jgi:hypothetical protein
VSDADARVVGMVRLEDFLEELVTPDQTYAL